MSEVMSDRTQSRQKSAKIRSKSRHVAADLLEPRRLMSIVTLSNGTGSGAASVTVDGYGAFGLYTTGVATQYKDFTAGSTGIVEKSYVYFTPLKSFLAEIEATTASNGINPVDLPDPTVEGQTATTYTTMFELKGADAAGTPFDYTVTLTQELSGPVTTGEDASLASAAGQQESILTQKYTVTNNLGVTTNLGLVRYLAAQISAGGRSSPTFGTSGVDASLDGGRTLVATSGDVTVNNSTANVSNDDFLALRSFGGSFDGSQSAIRSQGLDASIAANNGLTVSGVEGDTTTDLTGISVAETNYSPEFAQQSDFTIPGRQSIEFTTVTTLGQGAPLQVVNEAIAQHNATKDANAPTVDPIHVVGDFAFSSSSYDFDFSKNAQGQTIPLSVRIDRLGGTEDSITDTTTGATAPAAVTVSITSSTGQVFPDQTVTFAAGQQSATLVLPTPSDAAGTLTLSLSTTSSGASVTVPSTAIVNVLPTQPTFAFSSPTFSVIEGQGTATISVTRSGNLNGATSVLFSTVTGGTATAGADYTAQTNVAVAFADGQSTATVTVPILTDTLDEPTETVLLSLNGAAASATLDILNADAGAPFVQSLTTQTDNRSITGVQLVFSEALLGIGNIDSFRLYQRSKEGASGSAKLKRIDVAAASYDPATHSVTLTPDKKLGFNKNYEVQLQPDSGLTDLAGNQLNQSPSTGVATYTAYFSRGTKANYVDRTGDAVNLKIKNGSFEQVRSSDGDGATLSLFGSSGSVLTGSVKKRKGSAGTTSLGTVFNTQGVTISLPSSFTYTVAGTPT